MEITSGELTEIGEGTSLYIHWPGGNSGVTIGSGYDIGSRSKEEVLAALQAAGMELNQATAISAGAGLKQDQAKKFVTDNKQAIGKINENVRVNLLASLLPEYTEKAKNIATSTTADSKNVNARSREKKDGVQQGSYVLSSEQWDNLHPAMVEFITDLAYQGGTYAYDRVAKVNKAIVDNIDNDLEQFKAVRQLYEDGYFDTYFDNLGTMSRVSGDFSENFYDQQIALKGEYRRNQLRLAYLNHIISALESNKSVVVTSESDQKENDTLSTSNTEVVERTETNENHQENEGLIPKMVLPMLIKLKKGLGILQLPKNLVFQSQQLKMKIRSSTIKGG
ncbi:pesticin C-terminus-like muramidase [Persicobacter sp. CCB-QB2]|uniref:pesticin C-terminus-like muramidase n=1 Tax=Persicobacter sp. CCB-QB2 TaxID=1561025 RepID=UPI0006A9E748|nr:pesticin C-terminus-like muramidase [Persicobacter sp. CCB-QB2]